MASKVHYEDNLYFLHAILRTIEAGLRLDIDTAFFRDKVIEDLFFVDESLMRTFTSLTDNEHLINRALHLRSLRRAMEAFCDFLHRFDTDERGARMTGEAYHGRIVSTIHNHEHTIAMIDELLNQEDPAETAPDVVSSEEIGYLLSQDELTPNDDGPLDGVAGGV